MMSGNRYEADVIDPALDLHLDGDIEQRGRQIAYYLQQLAEELPDAMLYAGGETFMRLVEWGRRIGMIVEEEFTRAESH